MTTFTGSVDNAVIRQGVPVVPATTFRVSCPTCHHAADVPARAAGRTVKCPKCRESFTAAPAQVSSDDTCRTGNDSESFGVAAPASHPHSDADHVNPINMPCPGRRHSNGRTVVNNDGGRRRLILAAVAVAVVALAGGGWWYKVRADNAAAQRSELADKLTRLAVLEFQRKALLAYAAEWSDIKDTDVLIASTRADANGLEDAIKHGRAEVVAEWGQDFPRLSTLAPNRGNKRELYELDAAAQGKRIALNTIVNMRGVIEQRVAEFRQSPAGVEMLRDKIGDGYQLEHVRIRMTTVAESYSQGRDELKQWLAKQAGLYAAE